MKPGVTIPICCNHLLQATQGACRPASRVKAPLSGSLVCSAPLMQRQPSTFPRNPLPRALQEKSEWRFRGRGQSTCNMHERRAYMRVRCAVRERKGGEGALKVMASPHQEIACINGHFVMCCCVQICMYTSSMPSPFAVLYQRCMSEPKNGVSDVR